MVYLYRTVTGKSTLHPYWTDALRQYFQRHLEAIYLSTYQIRFDGEFYVAHSGSGIQIQVQSLQ